MENLQQIVEIANKTMLEKLTSLNVYFKINLKGEIFDSVQ